MAAARARLRSAAAVLGLLALAPSPAAAQQVASQWNPPNWVGDAAFLGANSLVGALTSGLIQHVRGGDFRDGFTRGALGGAVVYSGKRLSVERFYGAGLMGRQVAAVGVSIVRNAGDGRPSLAQLVFPLGPLHLHVDRSEGTSVRPKASLLGLVQAGVIGAQPETEIDWSASLSAGAPVFHAPGRRLIMDGSPAGGTAVFGSIVMSDVPADRAANIFAHERVHVLQHDFASLAWSDPLERWIAERTAIGRALYRYVDFGFAYPLVGAGLSSFIKISYRDRPHEVEAFFLADR